MIIFELILTTFTKLSIVFRGSWGSIENWLESIIEPPTGNLTCPNLDGRGKNIEYGNIEDRNIEFDVK